MNQFNTHLKTSSGPVMPSLSLVILSEAKNPGISAQDKLREEPLSFAQGNSARNPPLENDLGDQLFHNPLG